MAEHDDSFSGRARDSVTGWLGRSRRFLSEVRNEMGRVTWPSRKEVYATTFVGHPDVDLLRPVPLASSTSCSNSVISWIYRTFGCGVMKCRA